MTSPYKNANMSPYKYLKTPYQLAKSPYLYGLPFCPDPKVYKPVLTGPQNMYYMVMRLSEAMVNTFSSPYKKSPDNQELHGSWNNWLSMLQVNNGHGEPIMVAAWLPGNNAQVQSTQSINGATTQVAVPIWFEDGGQGGDHVLLSYTDSGTGVFVGNSYRVCTFGFTGITAPYSTPPVCGNSVSNSPQTQSTSNSYCLGCSPGNRTVLYLSWIDDNFKSGYVTAGWMRPNCASVSESNSKHVFCEDSSGDCVLNPSVGVPSLRGAAVDWYFVLGDYNSHTPTFPSLSDSRPPYLQLGDTFMLCMQGQYYSSPANGYKGWNLNYPAPIEFTNYSPSGDGSNKLSSWAIYGSMTVRNKTPDYSASDFMGYMQVVPLGTGTFPTPSVYCDSPPKSGWDWYCGGTSLASWQTSNPSCTPSHTTCIRNTLYSGWQCLGSIYGTPGGNTCSATCDSVPGVCDSSGNCLSQNALLYTPKCTNGKWSCVKRDSSWIAIALAVLVFALLLIWFFVK